MMDYGTIRDFANAATRKARKAKREPAVWLGIETGFRIPFLGDYVPRGWRRTARAPLFVDMSGFGQTGEPALTNRQMFEAFTVGRAYALIEQGQFQGYVAEYERTPAAKKRLGIDGPLTPHPRA